jgi:hypothetical protein
MLRLELAELTQLNQCAQFIISSEHALQAHSESSVIQTVGHHSSMFELLLRSGAVNVGNGSETALMLVECFGIHRERVLDQGNNGQ